MRLFSSRDPLIGDNGRYVKTPDLPLSDMPATVLKGVGSKFAETLLKLDIRSVQDLLFHLPFRYVDRTRVREIAELRINDVALVQGRVLSSQVVFGRRRALVIKIEDDSSVLCLRFFHFNAAQKNAFEAGRQVRVFGELRPGPGGAEMYHPEYTFIDAEDNGAEPEQTLTPQYHLTEGVSQPRMRELARQAVAILASKPPVELLPPVVNAKFGINSLAEALALVHFPPADIEQALLLEGRHPFQQRLAFEELLAHFITRQKIRSEIRALFAPKIIASSSQIDDFIRSLPFTPTQAQMRVFREIKHDLAKPHPMLRMVQGDVGSGKTLVAALAAKAVIDAGYQVAVVAPTEILAEQHLQNFQQWLMPFGLSTDILVGKLSPKQKEDCYTALRKGDIDLLVGTHALFEDEVQFAHLGLAVIDEQHRFGVHQRMSLRHKSMDKMVPHQLVMTATPIPRTLAMASYAEMDFSIIDELPPGRKPISTVVVSQNRKESVIERIRVACREGRQIYWVCPLIEESESLDVANAEATLSELKETLSGIELDLVHGRLKSTEKEERMTRFKQGATQILVATTVIEVGVDVPNASIMIIENPERLGLAQLHQLRGRVGRGTEESHCILLYGNALSRQGRQRLHILRETNDGFRIAEQDLLMRGPGEFLGTRQAGDMLYRIADHERDSAMYEHVHEVGKNLLLERPEAAEALVQRWFGSRRHYAQA